METFDEKLNEFEEKLEEGLKDGIISDVTYNEISTYVSSYKELSNNFDKKVVLYYVIIIQLHDAGLISNKTFRKQQNNIFKYIGLGGSKNKDKGI